MVIFDILDSGPVSEKPDEGLFFVDKETEEMKTTGMMLIIIYIPYNCIFVFHVDKINKNINVKN